MWRQLEQVNRLATTCCCVSVVRLLKTCNGMRGVESRVGGIKIEYTPHGCR